VVSVTPAILVIAGGCALVVVWLSVVRAVLVPRQAPPLVARVAARSVAVVLIAACARLSAGPRERVMTLSAPLSLFAMLLWWQCGLGVGFALFGLGVGVEWAQLGPMLVMDLPGFEFLAVLCWLSVTVLLALFVLYLSLVMTAYVYRERLAASLPGQAAKLPDAEQMLATYVRSESRDQLDALFADWSRWLSEIRRTHVSYPVLVHCRPATEMCWLHATMIILDVAALVEAIAPTWSMPYTKALLDNGIRCLERLAADQGIVLTPAVVSLHGREQYAFEDTIAVTTAAGLPNERSAQEAWRVFQDLRTRYAPYSATMASSLLYVVVERGGDLSEVDAIGSETS
jgi:hypothetical protein